MTPTVELDTVTMTYGDRHAVREVSYRLMPGETVALVGHNGAGKTTLMKLMLGLIRPSAGSVRVLGCDPAQAKSSPARLNVGFLPETIAFHHAMTGLEVMDFYARLKRQPRARNLDLLASVGLADAAARRVGTYSKGMRQRLGLAQALLGEPKVLMLDEPTTGLDPALRQSFYEIVADLRGRGTTVLLSSHALTELEERTDRVVIMHQGRMAACGSLAELRRLAELPVRIRVHAPAESQGRLPGWLTAARSADGLFEFDVANDDKMAALHRVAGLGDAVADVEIVPPSLDDIYAHFRRGNG